MPLGGEPRQRTRVIGEHPDWSPDGSAIAFTSARGGSFDVWLVELNILEIKAALAAQ